MKYIVYILFVLVWWNVLLNLIRAIGIVCVGSGTGLDSGVVAKIIEFLPLSLLNLELLLIGGRQSNDRTGCFDNIN